MQEILYPDNCIKVLDKGFVRLVDVMGDDSSIVQAARVSYGKGTKQVNEDRGLIRYLLRHQHTTPLEMVEFKFHLRVPIFVMRQWIRHRTANVNEYSGRYSEIPDMFYVPEKKHITKQSSLNKQGGSDEGLEYPDFWAIRMAQDQKMSYEAYEMYLKNDMRKELARINLPVSAYTEFYWKNDLNNIFKFLYLRLDSHAQYEIRVFAQAMASIVKEKCPLAYEAFEDYVLNSVKLTAIDIKAIQFLQSRESLMKDSDTDAKLVEIFNNKRELAEFKEKIKSLFIYG